MQICAGWRLKALAVEAEPVIGNPAPVGALNHLQQELLAPALHRYFRAGIILWFNVREIDVQQNIVGPAGFHQPGNQLCPMGFGNRPERALE